MIDLTWWHFAVLAATILTPEATFVGLLGL